MKKLLLTLVLLWPVAGLAGFAEGYEAAQRGDFATAMREWRPLAEAGDATAQYNLGVMYANGQGVPEDDAEAVKWYRLAAVQGDASAQVNLGLMYDDGEGVPEDDAEAVKWYRLAAEQGNASAQFNLGQMYRNGQGVPEDYALAYAWHNLAAAQGDKDASKSKDFIRKDMTPAQIARAQELSNTLARRIARGESTPTPTPAPSAPQSGPSRTVVAEAQKLLGILGYEIGPADGLSGQRTANAVRAFQSDLKMSPTGAITEELLVILRIAVAANAPTPAKPRQAASPTQRSSGSGFFVSTAGHIITNRHVIDGCGKVTVSIDDVDKPVTVESVDEANDLALLKAPSGSMAPATFRQSRRANLGEQVVVAGYPLSGLLSEGLNVTTGTISALAGIGDDPRVIQITAPVQPGNSGGPLLDKSGHVVGVVVSKLNAAKAFKLTGDIPQNINFAIKDSLVRGFLDIHGVDYRAGTDNAAVGSEAVAAMAQGFVVSVGCWE